MSWPQKWKKNNYGVSILFKTKDSQCKRENFKINFVQLNYCTIHICCYLWALATILMDQNIHPVEEKTSLDIPIRVYCETSKRDLPSVLQRCSTVAPSIIMLIFCAALLSEGSEPPAVASTKTWWLENVHEQSVQILFPAEDVKDIPTVECSHHQ